MRIDALRVRLNSVGSRERDQTGRCRPRRDRNHPAPPLEPARGPDPPERKRIGAGDEMTEAASTTDGRHAARVREIAYRLWEEDGRPHGRDLDFWERARALVAIEDNPQAAQQPNPQAADPDATLRVGEEAALEENLGEFPSQLTDQGDRRQTPRRRRRAPSRSS
jgi:Protein of unknown function (DUF2934)